MRKLTIKEYSEKKNISTAEVKRQIDNGELKAEKGLTSKGPRWLISIEDEFTGDEALETFSSVMTLDNLEIPGTKGLTAFQIKEAFSRALQESVALSVKESTKDLTLKVDDLLKKVEEQDRMLEVHFKQLDCRLRESVSQSKNKESLLSKLKTKFSF